MRTLIILRGAPGSGKSTFIKKNKLEDYTISSDKLRVLVGGYYETLTDGLAVNQNNDTYVWNTFNSLLEQRMKQGLTTILDATHCSSKKTMKRQFSYYNHLAKRYKYKLFFLDFIEEESTLLSRNSGRGTSKVPKEVISKMHTNLTNLLQEPNNGMPDYFKPTTKEEVLEMVNNPYYFLSDYNGYSRVRVIGDVHSCATVLEEALSLTIEDENTLHIFLGDYFDRGIEHLETLDYILSIYEKKNVILLEGNHEAHWVDYAFDEPRSDKGYKYFLDTTLKAWLFKYPEVELKKKLRALYYRLRPFFFFKFNNRKILCNHAGIVDHRSLTSIPMTNLIKGTGGYNDNVDEWFRACNGGIITSLDIDHLPVYQLHGHRKYVDSGLSYSLEGKVEFGGNLIVVDITKAPQGKINITKLAFENRLFQGEKQTKPKEYVTTSPDVNNLLESPYTRVNECDNNLLSINFTPEVFYRAIWNDVTVKARGLFVDKETGEVKARSYNKFFNLGERESVEETLDKLIYPIRLTRKENGFLGILSYDAYREELIFCTKSKTDSEYVDMFKELWYKIDYRARALITDTLKEFECSLTFEVVHHNDPHIIEYKEDKLFLLDFIPNMIFIEGVNKDKDFNEILRNTLVKKFSQLQTPFFDDTLAFPLSYPIYNKDGLDVAIQSFNEKEVEGFVLCDTLGRMVKYKTPFYNTWKIRRAIVDWYIEGGQSNLNMREEDKKFVGWLISKGTNYCINRNIIEIRKDYLKYCEDNNVGN